MIAGWREIGKLCGFHAPERHEVRLSAGAAASSTSSSTSPTRSF